jgi:transposase
LKVQNWFKARIKLAKAYKHLKNLRRDIYMKLGKWFAEHYDVVVMEDIEVKQLIGKAERVLRRRLHGVPPGAKGDPEIPAREVWENPEAVAGLALNLNSFSYF